MKRRLASNYKKLLLKLTTRKSLGFGDVFAKEHICVPWMLLNAHGTMRRVSNNRKVLLVYVLNKSKFEFRSRLDEMSGGHGGMLQTTSASRQNNEAGVKLRAPASTCMRRANAQARKGISQWRQTLWCFRSRSSPVSKMRKRLVSNDKKLLLNEVTTETLGSGDVFGENVSVFHG